MDGKMVEIRVKLTPNEHRELCQQARAERRTPAAQAAVCVRSWLTWLATQGPDAGEDRGE